MAQLEIDFNNLRFNGSDYDPKFDNARLGKQLQVIYDLMKDSKWRTLSEIRMMTNYPEASISAQLRHLKKIRFGSHTINKRSRGERLIGLYEYQLIINK